MFWIVNNWRIIAGGAGVLAVLGLLWYIHGAIYDKGYKACELSHMQVQIEASKNARSEKVKNEKTFKVMPITDVDKLGHANGWVRQFSDR